MIYAGWVLLAVCLYSAFMSDDLIDFGLSALRVTVSILLILVVRFEDQGVLEAAVLFFSILVLSLFALIRNEVQVHHDQS
ncbi:MAG: hypothetical protein EBX52_14785 [Proteobacteria bacterium]|nr:hypothetical protein [Pseudomonadota bacterium]